MSLREDTIVSNLPEFDAKRESTNHAAPRARRRAQIERAMQSLDQLPVEPPPSQLPPSQLPPRTLPPAAPGKWDLDVKTTPDLRVVPEPDAPREYREPPRRPQMHTPREEGVMPIPEPSFEPSVIDKIPQPPVTPATHEPTNEIDLNDRSLEVLPHSQGKVIVIFGCRGGAGATSLAINTASALVRRGKSVCVVDIDMQLGDVFIALDLKPETSIAALAREASTIDAAALKRRLARHDSGIYALTQIGHIDDVSPELVERIPALVSTLTDHFDYVIVDGVRDFGDYALSVLDMADEVAMILEQDVSSVRRAARAITLFRRLGYSDAKLKIILNRCSRRAQVSTAEIARALRLDIAATVRNDFKRTRAASNDGALIADIAPQSGLNKDLEKLATVLGGAEARVDALTSPVKKQKSLFDFFRRGGK